MHLLPSFLPNGAVDSLSFSYNRLTKNQSVNEGCYVSSVFASQFTVPEEQFLASVYTSELLVCLL
jgi:hypothetical protein